MADVLIRGLPEEVVAAMDAEARRLGLSRNEYLRRRLANEVRALGGSVTVGDLSRFAATFSDLGDTEVMDQAWR